MNKPIFSALSLLLAATILAGCSSNPTAPARSEDPYTGATTGAIPSLTTPTYYTPPMPSTDKIHTPAYQLQLLADRDFNEQVFLVVQEEGMESAIFPDSDDFTTAYADSRNRLVQGKYNMELACIKMSRAQILTKLGEAKSKDSYFCDLLIVTPSLLSELQGKGYLSPLDSLPFFQTNSICIRDDATAEINSKWNGIYGIWGDALRQPSQAYSVYYNRALAEQQSCPNLYNLVQSGQWDFQMFAYLAGTGKYTFDGEMEDLLFAAAGKQSTTNEGKALLEDADYLSLLDQLTGMAISDAKDSSNEKKTAKELFLEGKSLFYIGKLGEISEFADSELQTGLLPLPKYNLADRDYPYLLDQSELPVFACPINVTSPEGTGIMLSALNAASCAELEELFQQSAENQVRDNGSALMIPYCIGSLFFDRKLIYS